MRQFMKLFETYVPQGLEDEVAEIAFANTDWSSGDGETFVTDYARWADLGDDYDPSDPFSENDALDKIDIDSPDFKSWYRREIMDRTGDAEWHIEEAFRKGNGVLRVYRVITAPKDWTPDPNRHPGIWWSWDWRKADAHWGSFRGDNIKWMLEADVRANEINWAATLSANALMPEEAEIQLKEDVPVKIVDYYPYSELGNGKSKRRR